MSGVHNVGCQGLFSPAPEESVDIQGPFSQASTCASEKSSPSSIITPPRPSPTPAGSVDFRETSSTASTGVEEAPLSPSLLRVLPDSFTVAHEDIRVKMDSIFEEFCKTGDIRWINGDLLEHWLSVLEGVWRSSGSEDRSLEIPSSNTKYLLRHTYLEIYAVLEALWRGDSGRESRRPVLSAFITGTPGIGKTVFGFILAKLLIGRTKPALVFYRDYDCGIEAFWQGKVMEITESAVGCILGAIQRSGIVVNGSAGDSDVEIFSIGDSCIPPARSRMSKRILISSPGRCAKTDNFKEWIKNNSAATITLPPCSWDEMVSIKNLATDIPLPIDLLRKRFDMWGGVPRTTIFDSHLLDDAVRGLKTLRIRDALPYIGTYSLDHERHPGRYFHLFPAFQIGDEDFESMSLCQRYTARPSYWWATARMEKEAWANFRKQQEEDVIDFINTLSNDPICRGKAWEAEMHYLISSCGVTGELKDLETGDIVHDFKIQASSTAYFNHFSDIDGAADYWLPVVPNHTPGDSYVPGNGLILQMSVGKSHNINVKGVEELLDSGAFGPWEDGNPQDLIKFVFVLHEDVADKYDLQPLKFTYNPKHRGTEKKRAQYVNSHIKQYTFTVDLEKRLQELRMRTHADGSGGKRRADGNLSEGDKRVSKRQKVNANKCYYIISRKWGL